MAQTEFIKGPCVVEFYDPSEQSPHESWPCVAVLYDPVDDRSAGSGPSFFAVRANDYYKHPYTLPLARTPDFPNGEDGELAIGEHLLVARSRLTARRINADDAWLAYRRRCPLPIELMEANTLGRTIVPNLAALYDDDGYVVTLMLWSDIGIYLRFSSAWWLMPPNQDPDPIDGLNIIDLDDGAIDLYDNADLEGLMISVGALPLAEGETLDGIELNERPLEAEAEELTTSGDTVLAAAATKTRRIISLRPIRSAADVPTAIQAAAEDPTWRWYVEKRITALGLDGKVEIPWNGEATPS